MEPGATKLRPLALRKEGSERLIIEWSDGHRSVHTWKHLRENCPCASCRGERERPPDPFRILKPSELVPRPPLAPVAVTPLGHYAYKITWNDGHDSGIYTLEHLRQLCECAACRASR
ncbi:MAG: DUF971 domain-containing protein [Gemmataceae bacterium]|nr:DUF971 domain-containing protein [Gemmataceae bacterium]MDW8264572.1 DUF971 domain-containing protein [Gemmataceae bacterium]